MTKLVYVLLAHESASQISDLAQSLLRADREGQIVVHYDAQSKKSEFDLLTKTFANDPRVLLVADRVVCKWGEFGLVDARRPGAPRFARTQPAL